ncbi:hypothetical protein PpBr36_01354 [Pyricularia pennisetigena]|uniref:hypothetical protein n=1 Tax=Pyricularia pennisetigena TaxID=1578925 RepID=UPI0011529F89|nr:hypothetical protein PpBr36_01354 [Pyricularia pennisetigena]TLS28528.1 hypothetical protein PpBr36_01354 [Pyricularia pennisetigena]
MMACMSESHIMADCQTQHQSSNIEPITDQMDKATINDSPTLQTELAMGFPVGITDGSALEIDQPEVLLPVYGDASGDGIQVSDHNVDKELFATELAESEQQQQQQQQQPSLEQNTTETIRPAHKAAILTLPSPSPTEPQAGDRVAHRPELRWETRDGALFYREPGSVMPNNTPGVDVEGAVEVYWKPSGYFSWYTPTEQEKEAEEYIDKTLLDDGLSFYFSPSLPHRPVYHDLVTDQRYYFHERQSLCDPAKAAWSAVRERYLQMVSEPEQKQLPEPIEEALTVPSPAAVSSSIDETHLVWPSFTTVASSATSLFSPDMATPSTEAGSTAQQALTVEDADQVCMAGTKRRAPVTPERKHPPQKRVKTIPSPPTTCEDKPAPPPTLTLPTAPRSSDVFIEQLSTQQKAYMLDLCDIRQEPLIRDRRPEFVYKLLFDKTEALNKPTAPRQASSTTATAAATSAGRTRPSLTALSSTSNSQENPISLDMPESKVCTRRVGTASNPISIGLGIAEEDVVVVVSPAGSSSASAAPKSTPSPESSWEPTRSKAFASSPEPSPPRVTRSAEKKTAEPLRRDGFGFYHTKDKALLRYQQTCEDQGVVPGTLLPDGRQPDRLLMDKFRADSRNARGTTGFSPKKALIHPRQTPLHSTEYWDNWLQKGQATSTQRTVATADAYTAADRQRWIDDAPRSSNQPALLRGFPMVEMVTFLRADNRRDEGNCYWNALALHMYGRADFGARVKLEHLRHVEAVLNTPQHPRHQAYAKVNARFFQTNAEGLSGGPFVANMWQILHMPGSWTPSWMTQITADLYGVFVVLYTLHRSERRLLVTETTTRGAYNSRHIFLLFVDGNHYQPMIPNEYDPSEFRCPRPSKDLTKAYVFGDSKRWGEGVTHGWRHDVSFGNRVPMALPVDYNMGATFVDTERLIKAVVEGGTGAWKSEL